MSFPTRPPRAILQPLLTSVKYASTSAVPASSTASSSSSSGSSSTNTQTGPPSPPRGARRVYPERKSFLHQYYTHLLSTSQLVLLFEHANLSVADLNKIRRGIAKLPPPPPPSSSSSAAAAASSTEDASAAAKKEDDAKATRATLTIARTGILNSVTKKKLPKLASFVTSNLAAPSFSSPSSTPSSPSPSPTSSASAAEAGRTKKPKTGLQGQIALLTSPTLSPAYLSSILTSIARSIRTSKREAVKGAEVKQPELKLVLGIVENGEIVGTERITEIGKLPELDVLRSQLVGLLEMSGRGLVGVLGQAGGGGLVRTLQGLEKNLGGGAEDVKEGEKADA